MSVFCRKLAVVGLIVVLLASAGGSAFAQAMHAACASRHHSCDQTARISACCCGDEDSSLTAPLSQPPTEPRDPLAAQPACPIGMDAPADRQTLIRVQTSPPRFFLLDLPILFATFLI
jgi:hypothetical protein